MEQIIQGKLHDSLSEEMVPKFLATVNDKGEPNVVLVATIRPNGEDRMAFGDFLLNKTAGNLDGNPKTAVLVMTEQLEWWSMTTDFSGWEETGELVETFNSSDLFRYNAYTGIRRAGKLDNAKIIETGKVGKLGLALDFGMTGLSKNFLKSNGKTEKMPMPVAEKFSRIQAVKILSYVREDGYPVCLPLMSSQPIDSANLVFGLGCTPDLIKDMPEKTFCAVNVVTFDPVSYQIKGTFQGYAGTLFGKKGVINVEQVWCTSPPLCGERIDQDLKLKK